MSSASLAPLRLLRNEDRRLKLGHLWVFSNEIDQTATPLKAFTPGQQVRLESHNGKPLGVAYVNPHSLICARLISRDEHVLDKSLLVHRINIALSLRERLFPQPYYRLVYGESDGLPGLVVDRFGDHLVVQLTTAGMDVMRDAVVEALQKVVKPASIFFRNDSSVRPLEGLPLEIGPAFGDAPAHVELIENGVKFLAPLADGQKTGWFYDQRPNREWLRHLVPGKRVLDVFSYIGGFGVQAAAFGAAESWCVDVSETALDAAQASADLNGVGDKLVTAEGDAFDVLRALKDEDERFDVIIVDPPAFIKRKKDLDEGTLAYRRINELAMRLLARDGLLLSASCSMHLPRESLLEVVRGAGRHLDKTVQILAEGGQGADHPVHPAIPETRYIKALLSRVLSA